MSSPSASADEAKRRWINWTCLDCDHSFRSRSRRGLFLTCPKCGSVQRGPEGVRQALAELSRLKKGRGGGPAERERRTVTI